MYTLTYLPCYTMHFSFPFFVISCSAKIVLNRVQCTQFWSRLLGMNRLDQTDRHYYLLMGPELRFLTYQLRRTPTCPLLFLPNLEVAVNLLCSDGWNS